MKFLLVWPLDSVTCQWLIPPILVPNISFCCICVLLFRLSGCKDHFLLILREVLLTSLHYCWTVSLHMFKRNCFINQEIKNTRKRILLKLPGRCFEHVWKNWVKHWLWLSPRIESPFLYLCTSSLTSVWTSMESHNFPSTKAEDKKYKKITIRQITKRSFPHY